MSGCSLSVTHRSMTAVDGLPGIGSHYQRHNFKFNFCLDSCCTALVVNWDASELCNTWGELKSLHMMSLSVSMSCSSLLHKSHEGRGPGNIFSPKVSSFTFVNSSNRAFLMKMFASPLNMSWEETFWVFNLSLRRDALQSHKETAIVMNSIRIQPLGCWCISKACLGPSVVPSLLPKPRYTGLR